MRNYVVAGILVAVCAVFVAFVFIGRQPPKLPAQAVLQATTVSQGVTVTAAVPSCELDLTVYPADRIPTTNNWGTQLLIDINTGSGARAATAEIETNNQGMARLSFCNNGPGLAPGVYTYLVKGASHLRRRFEAIPSLTSYRSALNLSSTTGLLLIAGETSVVFDNFINGLDLSTQVDKLFADDYINDLNQDGVVNALDISIAVRNIYRAGD